ncbi:FecR family protein [Chitinophaga sp. 22321]|uniref:FecR domain-containing protein n=1 Tax=Chitinophaga hostae TaxID=2831022 RepID=A0ABS5J7J0_9BACT|nr:FecR family protein [Chitinophaga hostae]MBS0031181.1 FecR domain-containing protein [Chitinophaga hostae]
MSPLISDERFINYCLQRNPVDVLYWEDRLRQDPELEKEVAALKPLVLALAGQSQYNEAQQQQERLRQLIAEKEQLPKALPSPYKNWYRMAAAAVVLALLTAGIYLFKTPARPIPVAQQAPAADVAPGGNKAMLTLADGSRIALDDAANGKVAQQAGVNISKTKNGQLVYTIDPATAPAAAITYNTIQTPNGGQYQVNLPDGSKVWLNAASSLSFPVAFTAHERAVKLTGEAYFEIAPDGNAPFKVTVNNMTVQVLGTHFNIMAYANEKSINTTLLEGAVRITNEKDSKVLSPGQQARLTDHIAVSDTDTDDAVAWKNGMTVFKNADIQSIMRQISRWYDVEIEYKGEIPERLFTGKIPRNVNVSKVLRVLELSQIHFSISGKKIIVMP